MAASGVVATEAGCLATVTKEYGQPAGGGPAPSLGAAPGPGTKGATQGNWVQDTVVGVDSVGVDAALAVEALAGAIPSSAFNSGFGVPVAVNCTDTTWGSGWVTGVHALLTAYAAPAAVSAPTANADRTNFGFRTGAVCFPAM